VPAPRLTLALARRASSLTYAEIPDDVVETARHALLDWFGVTLGGCREDGPVMLLETLPAAHPSDESAASVVGHRVRLAVLHAALLNGTASHRLDFDDVNLSLPGHASVAVGGAALALAEHRDASGEELITAFVAGYETACRLAIAVGPEPYLRGFHSTGTIGTFAATAACARLLGLDAERTTVAFGIAASEAAGLKCNLGTMTKSLHAGKACENGLLAALLAARGFTASTEAIEIEQGFAALAGGDCDALSAMAEPPRGWHLRENLFKYHATCFFTHSMIDGIRELRTSAGIDAEQVRSVTVHVGKLELGACAIPEPASGLEVKFSLVHLAAMALLDRDTTVVGDDDAADPQVLALRPRIALAEDGCPGEPTRVEIELRDGSTVEAAAEVTEPAADLTLQLERLTRKFRALSEPVIGAPAAEELLAALGSLDSGTSVRRLMSLTAA